VRCSPYGDLARPLFVERLLTSIEELTKQIAQADLELSTLAKADATCQRLMTVPGVGPVTAMRFAATVDDVGRFANAHQLESLLGLVPGERWTKRVAGFESADLSQREFAQERGLSLCNLRYWLYRLRKESLPCLQMVGATGFEPATTCSPRPIAAAHM